MRVEFILVMIKSYLHESITQAIVGKDEKYVRNYVSHSHNCLKDKSKNGYYLVVFFVGI